jgi:hypothetical protein
MPSRERFEAAQQPFSDSDRQAARSASLRETLDRLEQAVGEVHDSDTFRRYLDAQARFHRYSFGNVFLILSQRPDATHVAGYSTWKQLGRQVRRGESGIRIITPMRRRSVDTPEDDEGSTERTPYPSFGTGTVFDIAQTEGEPLPHVEVPILDGERGRELYGHLVTLANGEGLTVQVEPGTPDVGTGTLPPSVMGYYAPRERRIVLRESGPLQMTKTLAHELAHHFNQGTCSSDQRAEEETIAESSAYVVCAYFGLDTGARSFPYVATWSQEPRVLKAAMTHIQTVSATIIDRLASEPDATDDEPPSPQRPS